MNETNLPQALVPYEPLIDATKKALIRLRPTRAHTTLFQSKFGGFPYLPKDQEHPIDEQGNPMFLLAQLNFAELPRLQFYPTTGILQFFVSLDDNLVGLDFDDLTNQQNFRVLYHEQIIHNETQLVTDFSYIEPIEENAPFEGEFALTFAVEEEPISYSDYRFYETFEGKIDFEQEVDGEELMELYADHFSSTGHKIGGFPYFTQCDPRDNENSYRNHQQLLLQIATDHEQGILWGDAGVANFFIREVDLQNRDFSNVLYTWDCH